MRRIEDLSFNSSTATLALSVQTDHNSLSSAPAIKVSIPKSLQSGVFEVSSTGNGSIENKTLVKDFTISLSAALNLSQERYYFRNLTKIKGIQGMILD